MKAHQDDGEAFENLSVEAKINVQCDKHVSQYFTHPDPSCPQHLEKIPHFQYQKVSLSNSFTRITSSFESNIHRYKLGHEAETQCAKTWKIPKKDLHLIDWFNLRRVCNSYKGSARYKYTKAIHRQ